MKKALCLLFTLTCLLSLIPAAYAAQAGVSMGAMEPVKKEHAEYYEAFTDGAGNTYAGAVCFDVALGSRARYDLSGRFSRFTGTLTTSERTNTDASFDIAIAVDGKILWSRQGFTRSSDPEKIDLDLSGAQTMEVLTDTACKSFTFLHIADGMFYPTERSSLSGTPRLGTLQDAPLTESANASGRGLIRDLFGNLHGNNYLLGKRGDGYAVFDLDKNYDTFTATVFAHPDFGGQILRSCTVYCDGVQVANYTDIGRQTEPVAMRIDVRNVSVLKIESGAYTTSAWNNEGFLVVGDAYLQEHIHAPGAILEDIAPTCAMPGKKSYTCTKCGKACAQEEIPALPHTPGQWQVETEATCTNAGQQVKVCMDCGAVTETGEIPVKAHVMGDWADVSGSLWDAPIYRQRICANCSHTEEETVYTFAWIRPLVLGAVLILAAAAVLCAVLATGTREELGLPEGSMTAFLRRALTLKKEDVDAVVADLRNAGSDRE